MPLWRKHTGHCTRTADGADLKKYALFKTAAAVERSNMAEYLSPGVYVEEFDSGIKAMEGVGTSTAGFVGMAQKGPVRGLPVLITSMADYQRRFGGYLAERTHGDMRFLPYAVEQFFNNGGSTCYVMRVCKEAKESAEDQGAAASASGALIAADGTVNESYQFLNMKAANPGAWGNCIKVKFMPVLKNRMEVKAAEGDLPSYSVSDAGSYQAGDMVCIQSAGAVPGYGLIDKIEGNTITLKWKPASAEGGDEAVYLYLAEWSMSVWDDTAIEQYENISFNPDCAAFVEHAVKKSQMITLQADLTKLASGVMEALVGNEKEPFFQAVFQGGRDGTIEFDASLYMGEDGSPDKRTGLTAFKTISDVSIMAIPGITDKAVQSALVSHCESMSSRFAVLDMPLQDKEVAELQEFRENIDSSYAAMYHPWLQFYDSLAKRNVYMPPSGAMAGVYGRTDNTRGVHKAPANEVVRGCTGLSVNYNEAEQGKLNPKGINLIRALPGQGIRVWGARTCSSDGNWKYVNVRRLFIFIEESIKANTNWAVFEPNDEMLWSRVEGTIRVFLTTQWRNGALTGSTADEAFFINIGKSTMTEDDILNGRLICVIGIAPVRPAEFVIFRITQKMESAQ